MGGIIQAAPAIDADGTIYIAAKDNKLHALYSSSSGLANSPWPKFRYNSKNTGRVTKVTPSPTQPTGVSVSMTNVATSTESSASLAVSYKLGGVSPLTTKLTFNATINVNGANAVFRFNSTALNGTASGFALYKLFNTNGTSRPYKAYATSADTATDGAWWITYANNTYIPASTSLTKGTNYYINFCIKDNGDYDEDRTLGSLRDPVILGLGGSGSSSLSGCMLNPEAGFGWEWGLVAGLPVLWRVRQGRRMTARGTR